MTYDDIFNDKKVEEAKNRIKELSDIQQKALDEDFKRNTKYLDKRSLAYKKAYEDNERIKLKLASNTEKKLDDIQKYYLKNISSFKKRQLLKQEQESFKIKIENARKEIKALEDIQKEFGFELTEEQDKRYKKLKASLEEYSNASKRINRQIRANDKKIEESDNEYHKKKLAKLKKYEEASERLSKAQLKREKDSVKTKEKLQKDLDKAGSSKERAQAYLQYGLINLRNSINTMSGETGFETAKNIGFEAKQNLSAIGDSISKSISENIGKWLSSGMNKINEAIEDVTSHRTGIMTRLQGIGGGEYDYEGLLDTVGSNLAVSPYITQRAFMQKLDEAVDKGIAYNVEQRAFLNTIKDDISATFDAFDSSLLRLIKLQQADSTAARLGMEAALTRTLNSVFSDTSYLGGKGGGGMFDTITSAIVEAESLMTRNAATEFEYIVQKWMGSLYSLGASDQLLSQIAQGINYIGTGNVQALASNSPLQTLFAMSASRGGLDYSDLLVKGLDASNTNKLLRSMVEYLKEIAEDNRNNNVVKAAYGDLYNMSLADMRAITSLSKSDISSIYSQNMSYSDMQGSLASQFDAISKRLSTGEMIKNVIDNFVYSTGSEIAENAISYTLWQVTDLIENSTGGIHLPAISVFGNMVDLSAFTIEGMMKTGLVGLATLGQIGNIVSSIGNKGGLNLNAWDYTDMLQRGQVEEQTVGSISSTSGSTYVGSSSSSDMRNSSIAAATEDSSEVSEITNAGSENEYSFDDWYRAILIDNNPIYIKSADEYSAHDIYKAMYKDKTPVPVTVDQDTGLGAILMNLTAYMTSINRITDVNIKKVDMPVPTTVYKLDNKLKEEIKNYIKTTYLDQLATELREALIGQTRGLGNATIAKVCDKILNDKVDVEVKNNNFDRFLDIQSGFVG